MRALDEEIRRRPAVPVPPAPLRDGAYLRPAVINQSEALQGIMGGLRIDERLGERVLDQAAEQRIRLDERLGERVLDQAAEQRMRLDERDRKLRRRLEVEEEVMRQRLRERQLPRRRFSVGPGHRRTRVVYDDGLYRWE